MRDVKFRAKGLDSTDWCYGIMHNDGVNLFPVSVDMNTIGQFTGLTDNNEKEIYEDDIMQIVTTLDKYLFKVTWNEELGAWCLMMKGDIKEGIKPLGEWLGEYWNKIELVGNIHDNEELWEY